MAKPVTKKVLLNVSVLLATVVATCGLAITESDECHEVTETQPLCFYSYQGFNNLRITCYFSSTNDELKFSNIIMVLINETQQNRGIFLLSCDLHPSDILLMWNHYDVALLVPKSSSYERQLSFHAIIGNIKEGGVGDVNATIKLRPFDVQLKNQTPVIIQMENQPLILHCAVEGLHPNETDIALWFNNGNHSWNCTEEEEWTTLLKNDTCQLNVPSTLFYSGEYQCMARIKTDVGMCLDILSQNVSLTIAIETKIVDVENRFLICFIIAALIAAIVSIILLVYCVTMMCKSRNRKDTESCTQPLLYSKQ